MMEERIEGLQAEVPLDENVEVSELHCHNCDGYIKFAIDKSKEGRHILICPKCQHEHCRIVKNGEVSEERWDHRNPQAQALQAPQIQTYYINVTMDNWSLNGFETVSNTIVSGDPYLRAAWLNIDSDLVANTFYTTSNSIYASASRFSYAYT